MTILDLLTDPWAIMPSWHDELLAIYNRHLKGEAAAKSVQPMPGPARGYEVRDGVAIIPLNGVMAPKINLTTEVSGGTSTQLFAADVKKATADPKIKGIIVHVDSPGGAVIGTPGAASAVYQARGIKPIITLVDGAMASAGAWVGTAADQVFISSSVDQTGSIGVAMRHVDKSKLQQKEGVVVTDIFAGKYKRIASENTPLTESGRDYLQNQVDKLYEIIVQDIATHRGVAVEKVLADMADGKIFIGQQGIEAGLVDGYSSLDELVSEVKDRAKWRSIPSGGSRGKMLAQSTASNGPPLNGLPPMTAPDQLAQWATDNPEAAAALRAEGAAAERARLISEHEAALSKARQEGAAAERDRAAGVQAAGLPGHEALIEALATDGHTTPAEAAMAVLAAERQLRDAAGAARIANPAQSVSYAAPPEGLEATSGQSFGPLLSRETDQEALHAKAVAYQKSHGCDYVTALKSITQGGN